MQSAERSVLIEKIGAYHTIYEEERAFRQKLINLLAHPRAFFRDHLPGHITASAWILDPSRNFALLTHHAKLNRWLQPGGHADGDEDVCRVALKEAREETGLSSLQAVTPQIFDLDIHLIPARNDFPAHDHYDIRFLLSADKSERFTVTAESHDLAWISFEEIAGKTENNVSIMRMAKKSAGFLCSQ